MSPPQSESPLRDRLLRHLDGAHNIPVSPTIALRLVELGRRVDATPEEYTNLIGTSPALSTKLLAAVNSSWYGVRNQVASLKHAVNMLGTANVRAIAITQCVACLHANVDLDKPTLDSYWRAALVRATAGRMIVEHYDASLSDDLLLVGILQDAVLPIMHMLAPDLHDRLVGSEPLPTAELLQLQSERFGEDHASAGAMLLERFGLPGSLTEQIRRHHGPASGQAPGTPDPKSLALRFCSYFPHRHCAWPKSDAQGAAQVLAEAPDLPFGSLEDAMEPLQSKYEGICRSLGLSDDAHVDLAFLLREATAEIADTTASMIGQLHSMVANAVQSDLDLSSLTVQTAELEQRASRDSLTTLLCRASLDEAGPEIVSRCKADGSPIGVAFLDIDKFKHINDTYGHHIGDRVLQAVGRAVRDLDGGSVGARYGGDEFVIVLPGVDRESARATVESARSSAAPGLTLDNGEALHISLSAGLVWRSSLGPEVSWDELLAEADVAMYRAKRRGVADVGLIGDKA